MPRHNIAWLIQAAVDNGGHGSENRLARAIEIHPGSLTAPKRGHGVPSDPVLFRLCNEAKEPFEPWLAYAHSLRNEGQMAEIWLSIADLLEREASKAEAVNAA